jgi:hypothetical protein
LPTASSDAEVSATPGEPREVNPVRRRLPPEERGLVVIGLAVAVLLGGSVPIPGAFAGLDPSWRVGINAARGAGLDFGPDLIWTYGPWGFLDHPLALSRLQFALGVLAMVLVVAGLWVVLYASLRRTVRAPIACVLATLLSVLMPAATELSLLAAIVCGVACVLRLVTRPVAAPLGLRVPAGWTRRFEPVAVGVGAVAGVMVQVKVSVGIAILAVAIVTALAERSVARLLVNLALAVGAFLLVFVGCWVAIGQDLGNVSLWIRGVREIVTGYTEAMAYERPDNTFGYLAFAVVVGFLLVTALRFLRAGHTSLLERVCALVVTGLLLGFAFKAGFIRHDEHELAFFVVSAGLVVAWAASAKRRASAFIALAVAVYMFFPGLGWLDLKQSRDRWRVAAEIVLTSDGARGYGDVEREQGKAAYQLPQEMVDAIGRQPVSVEPVDTAVAMAYRMRWSPMPVMQTYSAYTAYLDDLNADWARDASPDQLVLRNNGLAIDGRSALWETPAYLLALACDYVPVLDQAPWLLLRHEGTRCEAPRAAGSAVVDAGEAVPIPQPGAGEMVVASFEPDAEGAATRLAHVLLKDYSIFRVGVDGVDYRVPEALVGQPLLMAYPDQGDRGLFAPFAFSTVSFGRSGTVRFATVELRD